MYWLTIECRLFEIQECSAWLTTQSCNPVSVNIPLLWHTLCNLGLCVSPPWNNTCAGWIVRGCNFSWNYCVTVSILPSDFWSQISVTPSGCVNSYSGPQECRHEQFYPQKPSILEFEIYISLLPQKYKTSFQCKRCLTICYCCKIHKRQGQWDPV